MGHGFGFRDTAPQLAPPSGVQSVLRLLVPVAPNPRLLPPRHWLALAVLALPALCAGQVTVRVDPASVDLTRGQVQQFNATVTGAPAGASVSVFWSLSGIGTLTTSGFYTAPSSVFGTAPVTVTVYANATVTAGGVVSTHRGSATVRLLPTVSITLTPGSVNLRGGDSQQFIATVSGTANTGVSWVINPAVGAITPSGLYTAPATIASAENVVVTATSAADPTKSASANINLLASGVSISVNPKTATLTPQQTQLFTAAVTGTTETGVTWSLSPPNLGSVSPQGLYTAPDTITANQTATLTATSVADRSKAAAANITLTPPTVALDVGTGAPNESIRQMFVQAYFRDGFHVQVTLPPVGQVRRWGATGYIQEFNGAGSTRYALIKPDESLAPSPAAPDRPLVLQIRYPLQTYYASVGAATAGYPTMDSQACPAFDPVVSCTWALFTNNYALFAYSNALATGQNFSIRQNFHARWTALGGMAGPGRPVDAETAATSLAGTAATIQTYSGGAIFNFTTGTMAGQTYGVVEPLYALYRENGGHGGFLGFPVAHEIVLASGVRRQSFQGGAIEWTPEGGAQVRLPVVSVALAGAAVSGGTLRMNHGETARVAATVAGPNGVVLEGRPVSWTSSNSRVVTLEQSGAAAVLRAVGGGAAQVTASSEGKTSPPLTVLVTAQCCTVGEGAPTPGVQQAFLDAVARNRLAVETPSPSPVQRLGSGYVQQLQGAGTVYLLAKPDRLAAAYVVAGELLRRYQALGGPAGALGYPVSDATPGGRQMFENEAALAGTPVRVVRGPVLRKWESLGFETGAAGSPTGDAGAFFTFGANSGEAQEFAGGTIYAAAAGPRAGSAHLVAGPILARYLALGGPGGALGMPSSDEFASGGTRRQQFEGGTVEYAPGEAAAREQLAARAPSVLAAPAVVAPGSRVRLAVLGFPAGSTIRVSVSRQPDFLVRTATGAHAWELFVPAGAAPGTVVVRAADTAGGAAAEGSYAIRSYADLRPQLVKAGGDGQAGLPGARLPQALRVALRDAAGNPVAGVAVAFEASPGAAVAPVSAVTDAGGQAETWLRLPLSEGTAAATVNAPGAAAGPVTFYARAEAGRLAGFPALRQAGETPLGRGGESIARKGALLTAAAAILRYHQLRGELPSPNGAAEPAALNRFLTDYCAAGASGPVCDGFLSASPGGEQVVNLWRAGEFAGGGVDVVVEQADAGVVRDLVAQGSPVLLSLALTADGAPAGGHFVVAIGAGPDGGLLIHDPHPGFARQGLAEYTAGFSAGGRLWKGALRGAARLVPRTPPPAGFLLAAISRPAAVIEGMAFEARSGAGSCAAALEMADAAVIGDGAPAGAPAVSRFLACDGAQPAYQLALGLAQPWRVAVTDLAAGGAVTELAGERPAAYRAARPAPALSVVPQDASIAGVVNAADFTAGVAPGGLCAIFGSGLAGAGGTTTVEFDGRPARVVAATPFQVNVEAPPELAPGARRVRVTSPYGAAEAAVEVRAAAPAIFSLGDGRGAVVNQDGAVNAPAAPLRRGQTLVIYATGLGAVMPRGGLQVALEPVTVVLEGREIRPAFAGLAPGYVGLYQVNVTVAAATPPGIGLRLSLRQGGVESGSVPVAVE